MSIGSWSRQTIVGDKSRKMFMMWGILALVVIIGAGFLVFKKVYIEKMYPVHDYNECVAAGNPILETYPEQCIADGQTYVNPVQKISPTM